MKTKTKNTNRATFVAKTGRIRVLPFSLPPETQLRIENKRLTERLDECRREVSLYRDTLCDIRDVVLFGKHQDRAAKGKKVAWKDVGSITAKGDIGHAFATRCSSVGNIAFRALNWREFEAREEVRQLAKMYGLCQ